MAVDLPEKTLFKWLHSLSSWQCWIHGWDLTELCKESYKRVRANASQRLVFRMKYERKTCHCMFCLRYFAFGTNYVFIHNIHIYIYIHNIHIQSTTMCILIYTHIGNMHTHTTMYAMYSYTEMCNYQCGSHLFSKTIIFMLRLSETAIPGISGFHADSRLHKSWICCDVRPRIFSKWHKKRALCCYESMDGTCSDYRSALHIFAHLCTFQIFPDALWS